MVDFVVTPWEVRGDVDYNKLVEQFGTNHLTSELAEKIAEKAGYAHPMLRRQIFYSHRDMEKIITSVEKGEKFFLYTGRGPSGHTHLGHMMPWIFTKYLQDAFDVDLYFQITDDEKFLFKDGMTLEDTNKYAYENILDIIAIGFNPEKTHIFLDTEFIKTQYPLALKVAKKVTFSTAKAVFGFDNSNNIGSIFFTAIQSAPALFPSDLAGEKMRCLIPCAIDQDPHFRVTRDVAEGLGYYKPALIHCKMLPSLSGGDKMSASIESSSIFTTDSPKQVKKKIGNAFTGGCVSVEEQREKGGNPEICAVYKYLIYLFEEDDDKLKERYDNCRSGELLCGHCKQYLTEKINNLLEKHQEEREKAKDKIDDYMLRD